MDECRSISHDASVRKHGRIAYHDDPLNKDQSNVVVSCVEANSPVPAARINSPLLVGLLPSVPLRCRHMGLASTNRDRTHSGVLRGQLLPSTDGIWERGGTHITAHAYTSFSSPLYLLCFPLSQRRIQELAIDFAAPTRPLLFRNTILQTLDGNLQDSQVLHNFKMTIVHMGA